jgi:hypothetical protein
MPSEKEKPGYELLETQGIPSLYANHANVTISFHDIRVYFSEVTPKVVDTRPTPGMPSEPLVNPRASFVFTPEFAKLLGDSLLAAVAQYVERFGTLRPNPVMPPQTEKAK